MAESTFDSWQMLFLGGAAAFILYQMVRGWQMGVVRVVIKVLAVVVAYACAYLGGPKLAPALRPLGFPDPLLMAIGGALIGIVVFVAISLASAVLFKKTSDQSVGVVRFGYGAAGAFAGMLVGIFLVWVAMLGIRVLGTLTEQGTSATRAGGNVEIRPRGSASSSRQPGAVARGLTQMKHSLEHGPAGAVIEQMDPIPGTVYSTIEQIGTVVSDAHTTKRFVDFPGVAPLITHPKMIALRDDPEIARAALDRDFLSLMRNPRVVSMTNDPEIMELVRQLEFQKALDYAVSSPDNRPAPRREEL